jgi:hypothetical protein
VYYSFLHPPEGFKPLDLLQKELLPWKEIQRPEFPLKEFPAGSRKFRTYSGTGPLNITGNIQSLQ